MKNDERLDYIAKRLEKEQEALPVSLEKGNVVSKLQNVEVKKNKKSYIYIKRIAAAAAAIAVIVTAALAITYLKPETTVNPDNASQSGSEAKTDESYVKIENYFIRMHKKYVNRDDTKFYYTGYGDKANLASKEPMAQEGVSADAAVEESTSTVTSASRKQSSEFGQTNIQVENVDEGDILKNDGTYLYIVTRDGKDSTRQKVRIVKADDMKEISSISVPKKSKKREHFIQDIYLNENRLTVIEESRDVDDYTYKQFENGKEVWVSSCALRRYFNEKTVISVYDLSDSAKPKLISSKTQDGGYQSSRMVDGILYTVSFYDVDISSSVTEDEIKKSCVPSVGGEKISVDRIAIGDGDDNEAKSYVVISSSDTSDEKLAGASGAYLGYCEQMYSTKDTLYLTRSIYEKDETEATEIKSFSLSKNEIKQKATGKVKGMIDDRYAMDEYGGYFRVAVTIYDYRGLRDISSLYVLDAENLKIVGKIEDIAKNEQVKSARFMGDTAYIVTFENTDPLFVIDLSDPENPKITGEIKLPGFSEYLHPVGENLLLGVGYGGNENEAQMDKVKLTLFDVKDMKNPKVLSSYEIKEASTQVNYDPKAFFYYESENLVGIPIEKSTEKPDADGSVSFKTVYSFALFDISNNEIKLKNGFVHPAEDEEYTEFFRGTYIGDTLYTVTEFSVFAHSIETGEKTGSLIFS